MAQRAPAARPRPIAATGLMLAQDGVIATRPATTPEAAPREVGCPWRIFSVTSQLSMAAAGATSVLIQIRPACSAVVAAPPLKPNQPNQRMAAPSMMKGMLCGRWLGSLPKPWRLPTMTARTSAATPELISTTVPPAKSMTCPNTEVMAPLAPSSPPPQTM
ncbi:hypothetical protein D9M72_492170 [compost metagenome]